eukprot:Tbor_TRINITY_DN6656_c0_g1::TRINITY_DN6656_c0_g1_i1::g.3121::m.3121
MRRCNLCVDCSSKITYIIPAAEYREMHLYVSLARSSWDCRYSRDYRGFATCIIPHIKADVLLNNVCRRNLHLYVSGTETPNSNVTNLQSSCVSNQSRTSSDSGPKSYISIKPFEHQSRLSLSAWWRSKSVDDYLKSTPQEVISIVTTYRHREHHDITVTLIPLSHFGHPRFYNQVDLLLCQHDSVLMEGRTPFQQAPYSTLVPPRPLPDKIHPMQYGDETSQNINKVTRGWEPTDMTAYWQPFSWGVKDSPNYTVIHAADLYDYEKLPFWAGVRFNFPFIGSFAREKHCLNMIPVLVGHRYKKFAIPWRAAHMPIYNEMLTRNGFEQIGTSGLPVFDEGDGEISRGYVRMMRNNFIRKDAREGYVMMVGFVCFTLFVIYLQTTVEVSFYGVE